MDDGQPVTKKKCNVLPKRVYPNYLALSQLSGFGSHMHTVQDKKLLSEELGKLYCLLAPSRPSFESKHLQSPGSDVRLQSMCQMLVKTFHCFVC